MTSRLSSHKSPARVPGIRGLIRRSLARISSGSYLAWVMATACSPQNGRAPRRLHLAACRRGSAKVRTRQHADVGHQAGEGLVLATRKRLGYLGCVVHARTAMDHTAIPRTHTNNKKDALI